MSRATRPPSVADGLRTARFRLLYLEDNPQDADLAGRVLHRQAPLVELQCAATLAQAREFLRSEQPPEVVLADMHLPDGTGLELLRELRESGGAQVFVMITGGGDEAAAVGALRAGADDYIIKSGSYLDRLPRLLLDAVQRWEQRQHARSRTLHVLYAERNATDFDLLQRQLRHQAPQIQLTRVSSGEAVLAQLLRSDSHLPVDVLLLDFKLPGMNALELIKELRQVRGIDLPILVITGQGDESIAVQALKLGAADYIVKQEESLLRLPFSLEAAYLRSQLAQERTALRESEACLRQLGESIEDVFWLMDARTRQLLYISPSVERAWGLSRTEMLANPLGWMSRVHPEDRGRVETAVLSAPGQEMATEFRYTTAEGQQRQVRLRSYPVLDSRGAVIRRAGIAHDITEAKQQEERIQHLAYHDVLTGLPNRTLVFDRLAHGLAHAQRAKAALAVMFLDLDRFKTINDTLGHWAGDQLLRQVAERLREALRAEDTVARLGGDEFLVVLEDLNELGHVAHVAEKILRAHEAPFELGGQELHVTMSLGVAIYPRDAADAQTLLKYADTALYKAKAAGRNTYRFFSPEMDLQAHQQLRLENDLRRALERDEFELHYQPQFDLATGQVLGAEALLRWRHPLRGLVPPNDFIPLAEDTGLILPIGVWVLNEACRQARQWLDRLGPAQPFRMAVNLSARQLQRAGLVDQVSEALVNSGLPPEALELEITESSIMEDPNQALALLQALKGLGVELSVDDFGTGYSSLAYLKRFPIDRLKIDRSFIAGIETDSDAAAIVEAIVAMAHKLKLRALAEGVETPAQRDFLATLGCDEAQGYLFGRPIRADAWEPLLEAASTRPATGA
jgi:diguanylate cyclase (GGDEF)-like protein/PAS domain S-box-containing protein